LSNLTKLLYVDSQDVKQSFWKLIEYLLRSLKPFKDEHSAVCYKLSNTRFFLDNLIRVVLNGDMSSKNSTLFIIDELLSNEMTINHIQKTFGFNFLLRILKRDKNDWIICKAEKII
jgi:hypothetical protein